MSHKLALVWKLKKKKKVFQIVPSMATFKPISHLFRHALCILESTQAILETARLLWMWIRCALAYDAVFSVCWSILLPHWPLKQMSY